MIDSIIAILSFLLKYINFKQPKIRVRFENNGVIYHAVQNGYSQIQWRGLLVFTNISNFSAFNITKYKYSSNNPFQNININYRELLSNQTFYIQASVNRLVTMDERNTIRNNSNYKVPEFEKFSLIVKYENGNGNGKNYYSKYIKENENEKCKYLIIKTKI